MLPKPIKQITKADLEALVGNVRESKTLDYKRQLPGMTEQDKREFLADVSSFANASGGDLIYGISEAEGLATEVVGVTPDDIDKEVLRLEQILGSGLEPRLPNHEIHHIDIEPRKWVIVVRVRQSYVGPHRVSATSKFHSRHSKGKYELDVGELRLAFTASEGIADRIRRFREERLAKIVADETPVPLLDGGRIVLHVIPLRAFTSRETVPLKSEAARNAIAPLRGGSYGDTLNLEGIVGHQGGGEKPGWTYTQLHRTGIFEFVSVIEREEPPKLHIAYEEDIVSVLGKVMGFYQDADVQPPTLVFLSILGIKGFRLTIGDPWGRGLRPPTNRNDLVLPEVLLDDMAVHPGSILKQSFDLVMNAFGYEGSLNYDKDGKWQVKKWR